MVITLRKLGDHTSMRRLKGVVAVANLYQSSGKNESKTIEIVRSNNAA